MAISMATFILMMGGATSKLSIYPEEDIRIKHLQQHHDEQVKYDQIIKLLKEVKENTDESSN